MEEKEKPNYYAIIPANVRYDNDLKDKAKLLYGEITALSNKDGACWASDSYFSNLYGVDKTTIQRMLKNLEDKGYIKRSVVYKEGTREIEHRYMQICDDPYTQNCLYPIRKNEVDNNTSNNNTSINNIYKQKHKYGSYKNVLLTDEQLEKLKSEFNDWEEWVQRVDDYVQSTGKHYKDYLAVIRTWSKKQSPKQTKKEIKPVYEHMDW